MRTSFDVVEIWMEKGMEEFLPEEIYNLSPFGLQIIEKTHRIIVVAYPEKKEEFMKYLSASPIKIEKVKYKKGYSKDYVEVMKKTLRPIKIGDVRIVPPWCRTKNGNTIVIKPGMAFGTGRHESTKIMMRLMKKLEMQGVSVLDIGCGSGILSIFASKLGARRIFAIDKDLDAILSAKENVLLNNTENIRLACVDLKDVRGNFDVILANLDIETFLKYAERIRGLLAAKGFLIISGIVRNMKAKAISSFLPLRPTHTMNLGDFSGMILTN